MKLKKLLAVGLATVMTTSMLVGCSSNDGTDKGSTTKKEDNSFKIGMVTDVGGVNDESFNQSAWKGLQDIEKEYGKDKVDVDYLESKQDADYVPHIETFIDEDRDLIIGVGYKLEPAIAEAAKNYPDKEFVLIDATVEGGQPENVTSLLFEDNVSAYLTGLIAGKMTETGKVGFIGGYDNPIIGKFDYGFRAGVEAANPEAEVMVQYANSFTDSALGKTIAQTMHSKNADIIFSAAGAVGIGAIEAAKENNKKAIGVDLDQNSLAPDNIITSAMKNIDVAVFKVVDQFVKGEYKGGEVIVNTLEMDGVGIAPTTSKNVPPDVLTFVQEQAEKIKNGEIKVPVTKEEYEAAKK
ncbi:MAG: BMP family lipoprotein [Peptostreptococcaceae bacterium]